MVQNGQARPYTLGNSGTGRNKTRGTSVTISFASTATYGKEQQSPSAAANRLLDLLPAAIYTTDAAGRITYFNEAAARLWGCRPELGKAEFCGSWKLYWPDGRPLPHDQCPMARALKEGRAIHGMEAVAERPDGTRVPFMPYPTPLLDADGTLIGAVNMLVDISERNAAERTLTRHLEEHSALFEFTNRLFRATSATHIYEAALDAILRALGCQRASILLFDEKGVMTFVASRGLSEAYRKAVEGHSPWTRDLKDPPPIAFNDVECADIEEALKATILTEGIGAVAFVPVEAGGELSGKFMTYFDCPHAFTTAELDLAVVIARQLGFSLARYNAEEARRRAEQASRLLSAIVEASDDAIVSKDLNGVVTSWNRGAQILFGYTAAEMIGKPITLLIPAHLQSEEPKILDRIRRGERVEHYDTVRVRKNGEFIDISLSVSPVRDADGNIVGASKIARDITDRKRSADRQDLLTREIQHRTKNLFAVVQAVVARSMADKLTVEDARSAVLSRLQSLAQTHAMLVDTEWQGADIADVVRMEMSPYAERTTSRGPSIFLNAKAAQNFALALHELATNAVKYGALSNPGGQVSVSWGVLRENGEALFTFRWQERGGPPVAPPERKGFGSVVLEHIMAEYVDTRRELTYAPDGVVYDLAGSLEAVTGE
jgi:PAS domain S-box-containing protein